MNKSANINSQEINFFNENGFLIKKGFVNILSLNKIKEKTIEHLNKRIQPFELEQEVHYPGSPETCSEKGGDTIRRLLMAYARDDVFKNWGEQPKVIEIIKSLTASQTLYLVQSHHNCIMTKQPQYSSETHWHKDTRYWNFDNNQLINTWLPLGDELIENGCLQVLPGSHHWQVQKENLDDRLFLKKELPENKNWLDKSVNVELQQGDLLFFHAALFHAAGRNHTNESKNALVFTYHTENNFEINNPYPDYEAVKL